MDTQEMKEFGLDEEHLVLALNIASELERLQRDIGFALARLIGGTEAIAITSAAVTVLMARNIALATKDDADAEDLLGKLNNGIRKLWPLLRKTKTVDKARDAAQGPTPFFIPGQEGHA